MLDAGSSIANTYLFSKSNALKAAVLAYKMERTDSESGRIHAIQKGWKAFKTRQVTIISTTDSSSRKHSLIHDLVSDYAKKGICRRRLTPYELPADWKWSHGSSKSLSKHIVLRHWVTPGQDGSSIHTAMSLKDRSSNINDYVGLMYGIDHSGSWVNSKKTFKKRFAALFGKRTGLSIAHYSQDKKLYMSQNARDKLADADQRRSSLEQAKSPLKLVGNAIKDGIQMWRDRTSFGELGEVLGLTYQRLTRIPKKYREAKNQEAPSLRPYAFQKKNKKTGEWERRAQKVYLPCQGTTDSESGEQFVMFGLQFDKMRESWTRFNSPDNPDYYYRKTSKYHNCSGSVLKVMKDGGADTYLPIRPVFYTDQPMVDRYSHKLMERLDSLNEKSNFLLSKCEEFDPPLSEVSFNQSASTLRASKKQSTPKKFKRSLAKLAKLTDRLNLEKKTSEALTPIAIKYVEALDEAFSLSTCDPKLEQLLRPALSVYLKLRSDMRASLTVITTPETAANS